MKQIALIGLLALAGCGRWSAMTNQEVVAAIRYCKSQNMDYIVDHAAFNFTDIFGIICIPKQSDYRGAEYQHTKSL